MAATHVILRAMQAGSVNVEPGMHVDATHWRNTQNLVRARYMRPITEADLTEPPALPKRTRGREVRNAE